MAPKNGGGDGERLRERLRQLSEDGVRYADVLHAAATGTGDFEGTPPAVRMKATELAIAYVAGKPPDKVEVTNTDGSLDAATDDVLKNLQRELDQKIALAKVANNRIAMIEPDFPEDSDARS